MEDQLNEDQINECRETFKMFDKDGDGKLNEKEKAEAPVGTYKGLPIQKGKGRFGPFLKWNNLFVNIPRKFDPETIELEQMHELIEAKVQKEANRYIHQWPDEKITVENGRWGPYIKFKKKNVKIPKKDDGTRVTSEEAKDYTLEDVKKLIELEIPDAFAKKKKAPAKKKTTTKKTKKQLWQRNQSSIN